MTEKQLLIDFAHKMLPSEIKHLVEKLELDAFKAGMTEAAEICDARATVTFLVIKSEALQDASIAILAARDNKTSI